MREVGAVDKPEISNLQQWACVYSTRSGTQIESVHLSNPYSCDVTLYPSGMIRISTGGGGGHGDPRTEMGRVGFLDWLRMMAEVLIVGKYYFGDNWSHQEARN